MRLPTMRGWLPRVWIRNVRDKGVVRLEKQGRSQWLVWSSWDELESFSTRTEALEHADSIAAMHGGWAH